MGFIGPNGRGVAEDQGVLDDVDFVIGTFSKSVGTVGGFCVSNHPKFEILRLVCRPYVFTASLPPSVVATAATSIRKLMGAGDKRGILRETYLTYLTAGGSQTETAAALGIHRNTLTYRLRQIAQLLGHDPDDPRLRLAMHLALVAERLPDESRVEG